MFIFYGWYSWRIYCNWFVVVAVAYVFGDVRVVGIAQRVFGVQVVVVVGQGWDVINCNGSEVLKLSYYKVYVI